MRYDWDRNGGRGQARIRRLCLWWITVVAALVAPPFLFVAVNRDWTLVFPGLLLIAAAAAIHGLALATYGVREPRGVWPGPVKSRGEEATEAVEAIRRRQWEAVVERAYRDAGGRQRRLARAPASNPPMISLPPTASQTRPARAPVRLDPRWEWKAVRRVGAPDEWVKVRCLHLPEEVVPVESVADRVTGEREIIAQLCRTCDTQFPPPVER